MIIMKAFELPNLEKEWSEIFSIADNNKKNLKISEKEVHDEIQSYRAGKRKKSSSGLPKAPSTFWIYRNSISLGQLHKFLR
jgi:hypothetical protein